MRLLTLCVEGTKGAGKTTTIGKLTQELQSAGFVVEICAPFTLANEYAQAKGFMSSREMISASAELNREEINFIRSTMTEAYERALEKAKGSKPVVLIYDRGWMTILPHLRGGRWFAETGDQNGEIRKTWDEVMAATPPTIFLHASFEITKQRRSRPDVVGGLDTDDKLRGDVEGRTELAKQHTDKIIFSFDTGETPQEEILTRITRYIDMHFTKPQNPEPS